MYETPIQSNFRLVNKDYVPHFSYANPNENTYWGIPLSPNDKFFKVFDDLDHSLIEARRLPLEIDHLCKFHRKHEIYVNEICSSERSHYAKTYKPRSFMRALFISIILCTKV